MHSLAIVIVNIFFYHGYKLFPAGKLSAIVALTFQNAPESFHRTVINALADSGHTLGHACITELGIKSAVCILEASVAMEQRVCVRICRDCCIECIKHQRIIIMVSDDMRNNSPVTQVENSAQIDLVHILPNVILELCYIGQPLRVGTFCMKLPVQQILCYMLRIRSLSGTSVVFVLNCGFDIPLTADSQYTFLVYSNIVIMIQIILDSTIPFIRALCMNSLNDLCNPFIFYLSLALLSAQPTVVCRSGYTEVFAGYFYRISIFFLTFFNCQIDMALPYLAQPRLLSISSNFFSRLHSISFMYSSCSS